MQENNTPPEQAVAAPQEGDSVADREDRDWVGMAASAWAASTTYFDANIRREIEKDLRQWQSEHSATSKYKSAEYRGRSNLFRPKTRASIQQAEAQAAEALFSTVDVINIMPDDPDSELDIMQTEFQEALLKPILARTSMRNGVDWYLTCMGAWQETMVPGVAISKVYWQEDQKRGISRPRVDLVPIENFRFDPACDWRRPCADSPYLIEQIPMYVRDVLADYGDRITKPEVMAAAKQAQDSIRQQREDKRTDSKTLPHSVSEFSVVWVNSNIMDVDGQDLHFYTLGTSKLLSDPVPLTEVFAHGRCYTVGFSTLEAHKHYPASATRLGRELQRELNDTANLRQDNIKQVLRPRWLSNRNAQVDIGALVRGTIGSSILVNDTENDVKPMVTPDVTGSSFKETDHLSVEFDDVVGQFSQASVQSNKNLNETVGGMRMLTNSSNQVGSYRLKTFVETWGEPTLYMLVDVIKYYFDDQKAIENALVRAGVYESETPVELDELFDGDHEVRVDMVMGALTPQEKANLLIFGFTALRDLSADGVLSQQGMDFESVAKEMFAMLGYRDGSRFFKWEDEQDPEKAQLMQQIEQLQSELMSKQEPAQLTEAKVRKLDAETGRVRAEKVSKMVEAIYSAIQGGQVLASVPSTAPMADQLLADAGFVPEEGVDPNLPQLSAPDPALSQRGVMDPRTGVGFIPGGGENPNLGSPEQALGPAEPEQPDDGEGMGIETPRLDGVR